MYLLCAMCQAFYSAAAQKSTEQQGAAQPSLLVILHSCTLWLAVASAAIGYGLMALIMTATPISMHHIYGHSLDDTKWVIQSHIAFMFLPSLLSPLLIRRYGIRVLIVLGLLAYLLCIVIAIASKSLEAFWLALVLLGIGWNFLFVAGTSLLPSTHQRSEQFKVQAVNDAIVFSFQAVAALGAGMVLQLMSWPILLLLCLPFMTVLVFLLWCTGEHNSQPVCLN